MKPIIFQKLILQGLFTLIIFFTLLVTFYKNDQEIRSSIQITPNNTTNQKHTTNSEKLDFSEASLKYPYEKKIKKIQCSICEYVIKQIIHILKKKGTIDDISSVSKLICEYKISKSDVCPKPFSSWQCKEICKGIVNEYAKEMIDLSLIKYMEPYYICNHYGYTHCKVPKPTPQPSIQNDVLVDNFTRSSGAKDDDVRYIIHVPDIHMDLDYAEGSVANCGEPVCCRKKDSKHKYKYNVTYAGLYGSHMDCDAPEILVDSMFEFINDEILENEKYKNKIDMVFWVGDGPAHDVYNQSESSNLAIMRKLLSKFEATFMHNVNLNTNKRKPIPVFICLGNHDTFPVNQYDLQHESWLYKPISNMISSTINNEYTKYDLYEPSKTMSLYGYYTTLFKPGLRIISINTGFTENENFYLSWIDSSQDMAYQQNWLNNILNQSKKLNESVYILQHYPLFGFDLKQQMPYYNIYKRYKNIIKGIFAGHTHINSWHVLGTNGRFSNVNGSNPFGIIFNTGSITPTGDRNPMFRVYQYNKSNHEILDYTQFYFDLEKSNQIKKAVWYKAYQFKEYYGIDNLNPLEMQNLSARFSTNDTLWHKYKLNFHGNITNTKVSRKSQICKLISSTKNDYNTCCKKEFGTCSKSSKDVSPNPYQYQIHSAQLGL